MLNCGILKFFEKVKLKMAFHYGLTCIELKFFLLFCALGGFSHALFYIIFAISLMIGMAYLLLEIS